jgi:hypothetical protein
MVPASSRIKRLVNSRMSAFALAFGFAASTSLSLASSVLSYFLKLCSADLSLAAASARIGRDRAQHRSAQVHVIESIEKLTPELQFCKLANRKTLEQRVIQVPQPRIAKLVASARAKGAERVHTKSGRVEPLLDLRLLVARRQTPVNAGQVRKVRAPTPTSALSTPLTIVSGAPVCAVKIKLFCQPPAT